MRYGADPSVVENPVVSSGNVCSRSRSKTSTTIWSDAEYRAPKTFPSRSSASRRSLKLAESSLSSTIFAILSMTSSAAEKAFGFVRSSPGFGSNIAEPPRARNLFTKNPSPSSWRAERLYTSRCRP
jgi:hypothetical protein